MSGGGGGWCQEGWGQGEEDGHSEVTGAMTTELDTLTGGRSPAPWNAKGREMGLREPPQDWPVINGRTRCLGGDSG